MTLRSLLKEAAQQLEAAGILTNTQEVEQLFAAASGQTRRQLVFTADNLVPEPTQNTFLDLVTKRQTGLPLAYILGVAPFCGREFQVNPNVLIPRNETEELVEHLLSWLKANNRNNGRVLDVGTGSGCVAITLKKERPSLSVVATDISPEALAVARANAATHEADITFYQSDLLTNLPNEQFDLIVANLPYIPSGELANISPEVTNFEPVLALDGGGDGLALIRKLLTQAPAFSKPGGLVALEIWHTQGSAIETLAPKNCTVQILPDLAGQDRFALVTYPAHQG
jgi:release factor glutamine methyltransferase